MLLGALFHGALDVERLRSLAAEGLDWPAIVAVADRCLLASPLFDAIHGADLASAVPPPLLAHLRAEAALVASRNATFLRLARRTCRLLSEAGYDPLALKGSSLALHAPAWFQVRHQSDVDLLVPAGEVRAAYRHLLDRGFTPAAILGVTVGFDGRSPFEEGAPLSASHHLLPLISPEGVTVELHHALPGHLGPRALEAVRAGACADSEGLRTHGLDAALGLLCAHVHVHHEREPSFLLRHVGDVVVLVAAGASPEQARGAFGEPVDRSLRLVAEAREAVRSPGRPALGLAEAALAHGRWSARGLLPDWRAAFGARWEALAVEGLRAAFPAPRYMAQRYGVGRRSPLLPLTYLWRLLSALGRALLGR